jgi:uncharacterized protein HemX
MVVLGLLLMLGCVALAVDAVVQNTTMMNAIAFNQHVGGLSLGELSVAGAVLGLVFALGLALFTGGLGRARRIRRERRALQRDTQQTETLRAENARLEQELAAQRSTTTAYPSDPAATTTGQTVSSGRHRLGR